MLVGKYANHLPLYRQSQIFERDGIDLQRSTLTDWVGQVTRLLEPLADAIGRHVQNGPALFADDTPVKMQVAGTGKTAERTIRAIALGRKNWLFAGSEGGGRSAAVAYTVIETAKLNSVDPQAWLTHVLDRIAELLPWNCQPA